MIAGSMVYFQKIASTLKVVIKFINIGDKVLILDYDFVQLAIVNEHSERTIFFSY